MHRRYRGQLQVTYFDVPHGEMLFQPEDKKDTGSLMDTSITSAVLEFGFPVEFFLDMLCRYFMLNTKQKM